MAFAHVVPRGRRIGMVRHFAHDETASDEWLPCDGAILDPDDYPALQAKLAADGFPFGGDAEGAAVPDLQGRAPMGTSGSLALGDKGGAEEVTLVTAELPSHTHPYRYGNAAGPGGGGTSWLKLYSVDVYDSGTSGIVGGTDNPHDNVQPSLVGRWMIYAGCVAVRGGGVEGPTIGEVRAFATAEDVTGWALCGVPASRSDYPWLWAHYAALGYPYGVGDGATTFGTPPTPGRVLMGDGTGDGLTERTIGDTVGAETVTLVDGQLPDHTHGFAAPIRRAEAVVTTGRAGTDNSTPAFGNTGSTGGDDPHNNMAPTVAMVHRVYGGTDPIPDEGLPGEMPVLDSAWGVDGIGVAMSMGSWLGGAGANAALVIFILDWSSSDTWTGLYYRDASPPGNVEIPDARIAVVALSSGKRIHVCYLDAERLATIIAEGESDIRLTAGITLGVPPSSSLDWHFALVNRAGSGAPSVATSAGAATDPVGPSIAVTDATIACLAALGDARAAEPLAPSSETATMVAPPHLVDAGSVSATDEVTPGTYAATWDNPENVTAAAAVVLIPRHVIY